MSINTDAPATTLRRTIVVQAPAERAFRVFTEDFDKVKPPEHNILGLDRVETVFEPREGGRVVDRGADGRECVWGRVLAYEPPSRVVFAWLISPQWQLETDLARASEVEVRFIAETAERTRIELEHRHLDRHLEGWEDMREAIDSDGGWPLYLQRYADLIA
jgi:uncharacterized protein YndB with AHSA1/START domain